MRRHLVLLLVLLLPACTDGLLAPDDRTRELVGTYRAETYDGYPVPHASHGFLSGVMELRSDGTFSEWWTLVTDTYEFHGRWQLVGGEVHFSMNGEFLERGYVVGRRIELSESGIVYLRERSY